MQFTSLMQHEAGLHLRLMHCQRRSRVLSVSVPTSSTKPMSYSIVKDGTATAGAGTSTKRKLVQTHPILLRA